MKQTSVANTNVSKHYQTTNTPTIAADPVIKYMNTTQLKKSIEKLNKQMEVAVKELDFWKLPDCVMKFSP